MSNLRRCNRLLNLSHHTDVPHAGLRPRSGPPVGLLR